MHFLKIEKGSASEVRAQLVLATDIGYVSEAKQKMLKEELKSFFSRITGFIKYLESQNSK